MTSKHQKQPATLVLGVLLLLVCLIWRAETGVTRRGAEPEANLPEVLHKPSAAGVWPSRITLPTDTLLLVLFFETLDAACARRHTAEATVTDVTSRPIALLN